MIPTIRRDGDRIAGDYCGGFSDRVPDENLETYASDESLHPLDRAFAAAVLAIRRFERASVGGERRRAVERGHPLTGGTEVIGIVPGDDYVAPIMALDSLEPEGEGDES